MITTFLVEHPWITTVAFVTTVAIGPVAAYWLAVRPRLAKWLGLASLLPVVAVTLVPASRDLAIGCATEWGFPTFGAVELMANVVLFVPPVLLLGVAVRRPSVVCLGAIVASGLLEVTQARPRARPLVLDERLARQRDWVGTGCCDRSVGAVVATACDWCRRGLARSAFPCRDPGLPVPVA